MVNNSNTDDDKRDHTTSSSSSSSVSTDGNKRNRSTLPPGNEKGNPSNNNNNSLSISDDVTFRTGFLLFTNSLIQLLDYKLDTKHKQYSEEFDEKIIDLHVLSLSTLVHFMVHSTSLVQQIQQGALTLNNDYMVYLYRHLLTAGGTYTQQLSTDDNKTTDNNDNTVHSSSSNPWLSLFYRQHYSTIVPRLDLSRSLQTLRQEFIDDYDDIRYTSLRVIRDICQNKLEYEEQKSNLNNKSSIVSSSSAATTDRTGSKKKKRDESTNDPVSNSTPTFSDSFIGSSEILIKNCHPHILTRNVSELLLNITLPLIDDEWYNSDHEGYGYQQLGSLITEYAKNHHLTLTSSLLQNPANFNQSTNDSSLNRTNNSKFLKADSDDENDDDDRNLRQLSSSLLSTGTKSLQKSLQKFMDYHEVRKLYGETWLMLLRLPLPNDVLRRILLALPTRILPLFTANQPLLLSDFLTDACNEGNANTLLALQSLFILMQQHGLEYPRFYPRLYTLLNTVTASAKYRDRFFTLLDLFLSSPALPVYLVASFMKRLCRVALTAPLGYAFFAIPAVYNLCKRHPSVLVLLHRARDTKSLTDTSTVGSNNIHLWPESADPFNAQTNDLALTNAMTSSLWELVALQHHYHGPIATLARNFITELTKSEYDIAQYTGTTTTYSHIIKTECERTVRTQGGNRTDIQIPLEFIKPIHYFTSSLVPLTTITTTARTTSGTTPGNDPNSNVTNSTTTRVTNENILRL